MNLEICMLFLLASFPSKSFPYAIELISVVPSQADAAVLIPLGPLIAFLFPVQMTVFHYEIHIVSSAISNIVRCK